MRFQTEYNKAFLCEDFEVSRWHSDPSRKFWMLHSYYVVFLVCATETLGRVRVNRFERNRNQIYGIHFCAKISRCQGDSQILLLANFGCYCCWHWCCSWRSLSCHHFWCWCNARSSPIFSCGNEILQIPWKIRRFAEGKIKNKIFPCLVFSH